MGLRNRRVGVDVFFVLSGFLITGILTSDLQREQFSIFRFYERRARRILPALFLVIAASFTLAWMWLIPADFKSFSQSIRHTLTFSSNQFFDAKTTGYFATPNDLIPFLHTWSLSIEEQFYLFFPLALYIVFKWFKRALILSLSATILCSMATALYWTHTGPQAGFYLLSARIWELLLGAIIVVAEQHSGKPRPSWRNHAFPAAGVLAILVAVMTFDDTTPTPSLYTLLPVSGTCAFIRFSGQDFSTRILASKAFVAIGLISYSLYLWHQPIFAFARLYLLDSPSEVMKVALILVVFVMAYGSWRFVETPFRDPAKIPTRLLWSLVLSCSIGILGVAYLGVRTKGFPESLRNRRETTNLAALEPERVNRMTAELQAWKISALKSLSGADYEAAIDPTTDIGKVRKSAKPKKRSP